MRKLILQMQISLDGYVAGQDGNLNWLLWNFSDRWNWDAELKKEFNQTIDDADHIVLSGRMAQEGYIDHWTSVGIRNNTDGTFDFARRIASIKKTVFSQTKREIKWTNTLPAQSDLASDIQRLKTEKGKDIIAFGGSSFAAALLGFGLVDELQLYVNPRILGDGISPFKNLTMQNIHLKSSSSFECGIVVLKYEFSTNSLTS